MIVVPDVHGRSFWRPLLNRYQDEQVVFLGDYVDPYADEEITPEQAMEVLDDVIKFKEANQNRVTLLLGNHDFGYICNLCKCRRDYVHFDEISEKYTSLMKTFDLAKISEIAGKKYVFTHAPVLRGWVQNCDMIREYDNDMPGLVDFLNSMCHNGSREELQRLLHHVSWWRGGYDGFGSVIWGDVREAVKETRVDGRLVNPELMTGYSYVFGHTQLRKDPVIRHYDNCDLMCLDTRCMYRIDEATGELSMIEDE